MIFIGQNIPVSTGISEHDVPASTWALLTALLVCPFVWLKSLKALSSAALFADAAILFGLAVVLIFSARYMNGDPHAVIDPDAPTTTAPFLLGTTPLFFGMAVFTFEGAGIILPMQSAMREPEKFPSILRNGCAAVTILYLCFASTCYMAFGENTEDLVTMNMPRIPLVITVRLLVFHISTDDVSCSCNTRE